MALGEFELIARYFSGINGSSIRGSSSNNKTTSAIDLSVGDDCALLTPPPGQQLAISVDTLVADVHFPANGDAYFVAQKALRCNLSDLAAMGAEPLAFTLALSLPESDEAWLSAFSRGLYDCASEFKIPLIGGDTTRNPVTTITIQVIGTLPSGAALLRSGAKIGDAIYVSGTLGDARAALDYLSLPLVALNDKQRLCLKRYYLPSPRIALGIALRGIAHAAIDISDGLAADLGHILERSSLASQHPLGAEIDLVKLPLSSALQHHAQGSEFALSGGDDYELCFTVPQRNKNKIAQVAQSLSLPLTEIGTITEGSTLMARNAEGLLQPIEQSGYKHFSNI
ncbi:MAG TPA: thiamine-phosphate kinase [Spongiibacteraceae bacterium]|nr:thiamine-phosphate kinase [Spongiibacteraceae bacterium]